MTPIADMIEMMLAKEVPLAAILIAVRAVESASRDASRQTSRSPAAIRAARHREKMKRIIELAKANDIADPADKDRDASRDEIEERHESFFLTSDDYQSGNREVRKKNTASVVERRKGTRLVEGMAIADEYKKYAMDHGIGDPLKLWAEFVDYWIGVPGQRGVKLNWFATWRNRVRTVIDRNGGNYATPSNATNRNGAAGFNGSRHTSGRTRGQTRDDAILAGMGRIADRMARNGNGGRKDDLLPDNGIAETDGTRTIDHRDTEAKH